MEKTANINLVYVSILNYLPGMFLRSIKKQNDSIYSSSLFSWIIHECDVQNIPYFCLTLKTMTTISIQFYDRFAIAIIVILNRGTHLQVRAQLANVLKIKN